MNFFASSAFLQVSLRQNLDKSINSLQIQISKLANFENTNKEFLPKESSPKTILPKNLPKKSSQKNSSQKDPPKKFL